MTEVLSQDEIDQLLTAISSGDTAADDFHIAGFAQAQHTGALRVARLLGCPTLGLSGCDGGDMAPLLDVELRAPSQSTHRIQELHLPMYHALCACVEACLFA